MSRKAREPITIPSGVEVKLSDDKIYVKGAKGSLSRSLVKEVVVTIEENKIIVAAASFVTDRPGRLQGLYWALIQNMVKGVSLGFEKKLEMIGVGYRAAVQGRLLDLSIGVSHPTKMLIPDSLEVVVEKNTFITIKGIDKQLIGEFAATIRAKRPPEPYKGKGIRYVDEYVRRKDGKTGKTSKK